MVAALRASTTNVASHRTVVRASALPHHAPAKQGLAQQAGLGIASMACVAGLLLTPGSAHAVGVELKASQTTSSPIHLDFFVDGMTVKPAAEGVIPNTGHFHVSIDSKSFPEGEAIPFDATHFHYGKGQTSADLEVPQGKHKLTLQFANAQHLSYGPKYEKSITVNVK